MSYRNNSKGSVLSAGFLAIIPKKLFWASSAGWLSGISILVGDQTCSKVR